MTINKQWLINGQPRGRALSVEDFAYQEASVEPLAEGEVRVAVKTLSFDPSQKGQMENIGYAAATAVGQVMAASGVGEVVESKHAKFAVGDSVMGRLGWQELATLDGSALEKLPDGVTPSLFLGPLGGTGLTAYFGLFKKGQPKPSDTLVVSGAAGATGSIVGQLGKLSGCYTIGIAGGGEKCSWLTNEVGYDAAVDYKQDNVKNQLKEACPQGVDVFFDNVGGDILNYVLARIALNARVVLCGGISRYQAETLPPGPANYMNLIFQRASMLGFLLTDYVAEFDAARNRLQAWIESGDIIYKEDMQHGFENIPDTLLRLFRGQNFGKQLLTL